MVTIETRQAGDQPMQCKGGGDANRKHRTRPHRRDLPGEPFYRIERVGEPWLKRPTPIGQLQPVGVTAEQREPETLFQELHLLTDCGLGHVQLRCCRSEAAVAGRRFERAKPVQKTQMPRHPTDPKIWLG